VKLPPGVAPKYGWGSITAAMVGIVQHIDAAAGKVTVDYPFQRAYVKCKECTARQN
jgi:hypothetical protein